MSLYGKLEGEIEIKSPAHKFYDLYVFRPYHISNISAAKIQGCTLNEGEWGKEKSIFTWSYAHEGKAKASKVMIEDIDEKNYSITYRELEGDALEEYRIFIKKIRVTPKAEGCVVHWTFEYERLHEAIPHPTSRVQLALDLTKDIDDYLTQATP